MTSIGQVASRAPAIKIGKFVLCSPCSEAKPTARVILSTESLTISGHIRSFQAVQAATVPSNMATIFSEEALCHSAKPSAPGLSL